MSFSVSRGLGGLDTTSNLNQGNLLTINLLTYLSYIFFYAYEIFSTK